MMEAILQLLKGKVILPIASVGAIGSATWMTQIHFTTIATAETVKEMVLEVKNLKSDLSNYKVENQEKLFNKLSDIEKRLGRIEGRLNN